MQFVEVFKKYLISSQIFVSICAASLGSFVMLEQEAYQNYSFWILFFTFWNGYLFTIFRKRKIAVWMSFMGFVLLSFFQLIFIDIQTYFKWLIAIFIGLLYNADIFGIRIREFSLIKTFYVGFVWALFLTFYPLPHFSGSWFLMIFLFVCGITFPFEIRDINKDPFLTLPKAIGIRNTKILSLIFLISSGIIGLHSLQLAYSIPWFCSILLAITLVLFSHQKRTNLYYSFFMESLSLMPLVLYWIIQKIQ